MGNSLSTSSLDSLPLKLDGIFFIFFLKKENSPLTYKHKLKSCELVLKLKKKTPKVTNKNLNQIT